MYTVAILTEDAVAVGRKDDEKKILQGVLDEPKQALKVTFADAQPISFEGGEQDVEISAMDGDTIAIQDPVSGNTAAISASRRLQVETSGTSTATIPPPTDFRVRTYTVAADATAISFSGFTVSALSIKALGENPGLIRIGKSNVATSSDDFYLLGPNEPANVPLAASSEPVYFSLHPGEPVGTYKITVIAVN